MASNATIAKGVFEDLFSRGTLGFIDQYFDPGFRGHETLIQEFDRDQLRENVQAYRRAFPDLVMTCDEVVDAGDKVLVRWTVSGTHRGLFLGLSPTGKSTSVKGLSVMTFRDGRIVEDWTQWDAFGLLRELGVTSGLAVGAQPTP